eukprot:Sspe_Gene.1806::Locus_602_Transcript_1_1_Confidence_1.000_Length_1829::g.1806::m.1806/K09553/STIP1; stress-induced-phosphoprotein 1
MYDKALETEPDNIQYMNNKAAVYLEQGDHEKCLAECDKAIEKGRETRGDFKDIAKAMSRKGASFQRQKNWDEAIKWYKESLLEHRNGDTLDKLNKCEAAKKKAEEEAYLNPELSEEAKNRGNEFFRNQQFKEAIDEYNEAIKRNPSNHALYSNRAAAYMKMGAYDEAEKDCEKCLKICPTFVKAIVRKAHIYFFRKEYHKAMVEYEKGLKLEPDNAECKNGVGADGDEDPGGFVGWRWGRRDACEACHGRPRDPGHPLRLVHAAGAARDQREPEEPTALPALEGRDGEDQQTHCRGDYQDCVRETTPRCPLLLWRPPQQAFADVSPIMINLILSARSLPPPPPP